MIEVKDLRLNNKVLFNGVNSEIFEIRQNNKIRIKFFRTDNNKDHVGLVDVSDIQPIPLTEEWLNKYETIYWLNHDGKRYHYYFFLEKKYIDHFHTLQNLYYIIENKELQLKQ